MSFKEWFSNLRVVCLMLFRRTCWKHGTLLKDLIQGYFDSNLKKFSKEMFQWTPPDIFDSCFNHPLMLRITNGKFQIERFHPNLLQGRYSCLNFKNCVVSICRATISTSQAPKIELYTRIIKQHYINVVNYICKKLRRRCLQEFWIMQ